MTKTLMDAIKGWMDKHGEGLNRGAYGELYRILYEYRHAEPKEDCRKICDNFGSEGCHAEMGEPQEDCPILKFSPDKAVEPLAVLADRKGYWTNVNHYNNIWRIYGSVTDGLFVSISEWSFEAPTYAAAEAKARQYLEALPDVKGENI